MKILKWFLKFFQPTVKLPRRVKFVEGTEWLCPRCRATLAIARRDIHAGDVARSVDWDIRDPGFWKFEHCDAHVIRYGDDGRTRIMTPTGWVG